MAVTIFNTIKKPAGGSYQDDFDVAVTLSWDTDVSAVALHTEGEAMLKGTYQTETDSTGKWEVEVIENDLVSPADSVYKITETERNTSNVVNEYYISVPQDATPGDRWVGDLIVATPAWEA
jgi:hypothetical protein